MFDLTRSINFSEFDEHYSDTTYAPCFRCGSDTTSDCKECNNNRKISSIHPIFAMIREIIDDQLEDDDDVKLIHKISEEECQLRDDIGNQAEDEPKNNIQSQVFIVSPAEEKFQNFSDFEQEFRMFQNQNDQSFSQLLTPQTPKEEANLPSARRQICFRERIDLDSSNEIVAKPVGFAQRYTISNVLLGSGTLGQSFEMKSSGHSEQPLRDDYFYSIHCDACDEKPIRNIKYSCNICPDFDLCRKCYLSHVAHPHPLRDFQCTDLQQIKKVNEQQMKSSYQIFKRPFKLRTMNSLI